MSIKYPSQNNYNKTHRPWARNLQKEYSQRVKQKILDAYGNKCACCGESHPEFLCVDHINGGGKQERKKRGSGTVFYRWLIKENFPDGYRILCYNCNCALGHLGYCPHGNIEGHNRHIGRPKIYP